MKDLFDTEGRRVAWLLHEIERQTTDRLSEKSRQDLLDEVSAHLDAAIQARLELGMSPLEAETEAVESFGHPKAYIDDLLAVHEKAATNSIPVRHSRFGDRKTMTALAVAAVYSCFWILSGIRTVEVQAILIGLSLVAIPFAIYSYRARRVQFFPIFLSSMATYLALCFVMCLTWHNLWLHGGLGIMPRWEAGHQKELDQASLSKIDSMLIPLHRRLMLHGNPNRPGLAALNLPSAESLLVPVPRDIPYNNKTLVFEYNWTPNPDSAIEYVQAKDAAEADNVWRTRGIPLNTKLVRRSDELQERIRAISNAQTSWIFSDFLINLQQTAIAVPFWFGFWALLNFVSGGLGWFLALPPSIRRRKTA